METWKLYYDGGCNLCHVSQLRAEKWAQKSGQPLHVDILQSDDAIAKGYGDAMVLEVGDEVYLAANAWLKLMSVAPWYFRWISWFGGNPFMSKLANLAYDVVAKYRYKWFGTRVCQIPIRDRR